jgi:hypothetical protein
MRESRFIFAGRKTKIKFGEDAGGGGTPSAAAADPRALRESSRVLAWRKTELKYCGNKQVRRPRTHARG